MDLQVCLKPVQVLLYQMYIEYWTCQMYRNLDGKVQAYLNPAKLDVH
jgi:hypothetical protein